MRVVRTPQPRVVDIGRYRNQYRLKYLESVSVWDGKVTENKVKTRGEPT